MKSDCGAIWSGPWYCVNSMQMHRADRVADWQKPSVKQLNSWQRVARRTNGIVTPGNALSALGLALVFWGLVLLAGGHAIAGLIAIGVGRLADIVDGAAADRTGTKSPLGEAVDTTFDKIGVLATVLVFVAYGFTPLWLVALILLQHLAMVLASLLAKLRHVALHPSRAGKLAMAAVWTALGLFGVAHLLILHDWRGAELVALTGGYIMAAVSLGLGAAAVLSYYRQVITPKA